MENEAVAAAVCRLRVTVGRGVADGDVARPHADRGGRARKGE